MRQAPLVSIVVPVYNGEMFLAETIDSILAQSYEDWELLLIDDGSTDGSAEIIRGYSDKRIQYVKGERKGNPAGVRNLGISLAKGEWIALCDQDDLWAPYKLERQVMCIGDGVGMVVGSSDSIGEDGKPIPRIVSKTKTMIEEFLSNKSCVQIPNFVLFRENYIMNSTVLVKRTIFDKIGMLSEDPDLRGVEDYEFLIRLLCNGYVISYVPQILASWRQHSSNLTKEIHTKSVHRQRILHHLMEALTCKEFGEVPRILRFQRILELRLKICKIEQRRSFRHRLIYLMRFVQWVVSKRFLRLFGKSYY